MNQIPRNNKNKIYMILGAVLTLLLSFTSASSEQTWSGFRPPNCKCHSKNPKMVEMHKPFGVKDCLICHQPTGMQMQKNGQKDNNTKMEIAQQQKNVKKVCKECHTLK